MKTFRWVRIADVKGHQFISLFDITNYREDGSLFAVGSVVPAGSKFRPVVITYPEYITTEETMSLTDAILAVEKKLMDIGVIGEGDMVEE